MPADAGVHLFQINLGTRNVNLACAAACALRVQTSMGAGLLPLICNSKLPHARVVGVPAWSH